MAMTKATAETHLDAWIAADLAVSKAQTYSIAGRTLTRADTSEIRANIAYWQQIIDRFDAAALGVKRPSVAIAVNTR